MNEDMMLILLLTHFAKEGFPSTDPKEQVALAFLYVELIIAYKTAKQKITSEKEHKLSDQELINLSNAIMDGIPKCPKCYKPCTVVDASTLSDPGVRLHICTDCAWQETVHVKEGEK